MRGFQEAFKSGKIFEKIFEIFFCSIIIGEQSQVVGAREEDQTVIFHRGHHLWNVHFDVDTHTTPGVPWPSFWEAQVFIAMRCLAW